MSNRIANVGELAADRPTLPVIVAPDRTEVPAYYVNSGGMVDLFIRTDSRREWETFGLKHGFLVQETDEKGVTRIKAARDVDLAYPTIVVTPGTYDTEGNELTAPVLDQRLHVNVRLARIALTVVKWKGALLHLMQQGTNLTKARKNKREDGKRSAGVELLNPLTINSPSSVWL